MNTKDTFTRNDWKHSREDYSELYNEDGELRGWISRVAAGPDFEAWECFTKRDGRMKEVKAKKNAKAQAMNAVELSTGIKVNHTICRFSIKVEKPGLIHDAMLGEAFHADPLPEVLAQALCENLNLSPYSANNGLGQHPVSLVWEQGFPLAKCAGLPDAPRIPPRFEGGVCVVEVWDEKSARAWASRAARLTLTQRIRSGYLSAEHIGDALSDMFPPGCEPDALEAWMKAVEETARLIDADKSALQREWESLTMEAYETIPDTAQVITLIRLGDFYETFEEHAKLAAPIMGVALTKRCGVVMCGFPVHSALRYTKPLLEAGYHVIACGYKDDVSPQPGAKNIPPRIIQQRMIPVKHRSWRHREIRDRDRT